MCYREMRVANGTKRPRVHDFQDVPASTLEEELKDLEELWPEKSFTHRKALVELLVKKVVIHYETPRFCKVLVEWSYSEWGTEERLLDRRIAGGREWTEQEKQVLSMMYESGDQIDIMCALPHRTWSGICDTATSLGLRRQSQKNGGDTKSQHNYGRSSVFGAKRTHAGRPRDL